MKLRLDPIEEEKPAKITLEIPASLFRDMEAYGRLLAGAGQPPITPEKLIIPMLTKFIAGDRVFQKELRAERAKISRL